jgi:hypothetical protein
MIPRLLLLLVLVPIALLPSGCVSSEDQADAAATWQAAPEKPEDSHGWGTNVGDVSGGRN